MAKEWLQPFSALVYHFPMKLWLFYAPFSAEG
jgi:hypothetical protein